MTEDPEALAAIDELMQENVRLGYAEVVRVGEDGKVFYRLTQAGIKHVESLGKEGE